MVKGSILLGTPEFWGRTVTNLATIMERLDLTVEYKTAQLHERVLTADWKEIACLLWDMYDTMLRNRLHLERHRDRGLWISALRVLGREAALGDVVIVQDARHNNKPHGIGHLILIDPETDDGDETDEHGGPPILPPRHHIRALDGSVIPWVNCDLSAVPTEKHFSWDRDRQAGKW